MSKMLNSQKLSACFGANRFCGPIHNDRSISLGLGARNLNPRPAASRALAARQIRKPETMKTTTPNTGSCQIPAPSAAAWVQLTPVDSSQQPESTGVNPSQPDPFADK